MDEQEIALAWLQNCRDAIRLGSDSREADANFWAYSELRELCSSDPGTALDIIVRILSERPEERVLYNLAAGPLEDLLTKNGQHVMARVKRLADSDPAFLFLIGGVWIEGMPTDVQDELRPLLARADTVPLPAAKTAKDH